LWNGGTISLSLKYVYRHTKARSKLISLEESAKLVIGIFGTKTYWIDAIFIKNSSKKIKANYLNLNLNNRQHY